MNRRIVIAAAVAAALLFRPATSLACTCADVDPKRLVAEADVIFDGTAVQGSMESADGRLASWRFEVDRAFKGDARGAATVSTHTSAGMGCGAEFFAGRRYRVFAFRDDHGGLATDQCSGTGSAAAPIGIQAAAVAPRAPDGAAGAITPGVIAGLVVGLLGIAAIRAAHRRWR